MEQSLLVDVQTSNEKQCCPLTSLQDQQNPVTADAWKKMQKAQWVEPGLGTLPPEPPPQESSASRARGGHSWVNLILPWRGVTPKTMASV